MEMTVRTTVALERMWIYARRNTLAAKELMADEVLAGNEITYHAYDATNKFIGRTTLKPNGNGTVQEINS